MISAVTQRGFTPLSQIPAKSDQAEEKRNVDGESCRVSDSSEHTTVKGVKVINLNGVIQFPRGERRPLFSS